MADWKTILSENEHQPGDEELLNYLRDELSEAQKHDFEQKTLDSAFINDALEGLQSVKSQHLPEFTAQINKKLQQQLADKKQRTEKRKVIENRWLVLAIIMLLAICVLGYLLVTSLPS